MNRIEYFKGKNRFLSNFHLDDIYYTNYPPENQDQRYVKDTYWCGTWYPSVENAYQAAKTHLTEQKSYFVTCTPYEAKLMGKKVTLRHDWEDIKLQVMKELVFRKFDRGHPLLKFDLLKTGDAEIIEGNTWGDTYWGQCPIGVGENYLGKIIMEVREELRRKNATG